MIGLANSGTDTVNCVKQAHEFGLTPKGATLAALLMMLPDLHGVGLETAQGLMLSRGVLLGHERPAPALTASDSARG